MYQLEANKKIVAQYVDMFNRGELDSMPMIFTLDAVVYGVLGEGGLQEVIPIWHELQRAFGVKLKVEQMIAEGDHVAARMTERGTFVGPFRGHEPTGKSYEINALEWFVLKNDRIHRRWGIRDWASQGRQIGLPVDVQPAGMLL